MRYAPSEKVDPFTSLPDWHLSAACRGMDSSVFFIARGGSSAEAKTVCGGCRVRQECLSWAVSENEKLGIWGGLTTKERRKVRRERVA